MSFRISVLVLWTILRCVVIAAQVPDPPDQSPDSAAVCTEDLLEQRSDEDEIQETDAIRNIDFTLSVRSRILTRDPQPSGYSDGYYSGSADKVYNRILFTIGKKTAGGILMEKDAGERGISNFTTMNVSFQNACPLLKELALGDYRVESGQGLILSSGRGYTKGADVITPVIRRSRGIVPTLSTDEFHFFRGIGTEVSWKSLTALLFLSVMRRSASLDDDGNILSFNKSGYYRTDKELSRRNNTDERVLGGRISLQLPDRGGCVGITCLAKKYSREFASAERSAKVNAASFDISLNFRQVSMFGEFARENDDMALIGGIRIIPQKKVKIIMSYRFYPPAYAPLHTLPFGEWGSGERGYYYAMTVLFLKKADLSIYMDLFEKLAADDFSSGGNDLLMNIRYPVSQKLTLTAQYRRKVNEYRRYIVNPEMLPAGSSSMNSRQKFRLNLDYLLSSSLSLRVRLEKIFFSDGRETPGEKGLLFYQNITFKSLKYWMFSVRVSYFRSQSREAVPYELESDLDGVLTQAMFSGEGIRFYLLAAYDGGKWLRISAKYALLRRDDVLKIGSGHDQLPSGTDSRISAQIDICLK